MRYVPALDGLRGVAVLVVVLYHADLGVATGGFLGVSLFFTLSGFLIASVLLHEHDETGRISLRRFYERRVRRLLPASLVCLALVVALTNWWSPAQRADLAGDVVASALNVANWRFAFSDTSYAELLSGQPSPVAHFWSLAIEEQLYLLVPLIIVGGRRLGRRVLVGTVLVLIVASSTATLLTTDRDLVYNGTHTRAAEVLVGVLLAVWFHGRHRSSMSTATVREPRRPTGVDLAVGLVASAAFIALVSAAAIDQPWVYRGGLVLVAGVSAMLIGLVADGRFPAAALEFSPLVALGRVSYGVYLFHWPVFVLLDAERVGVGGPALFVLRCGVTAVLTFASYRLLEQPIRHGRRVTRGAAVAAAGVIGTVAVVVAAVMLTPAPARTATDAALALGADEVVVFTPASPNPVDDAVNAASDAPALAGEPGRVGPVVSVASAPPAAVEPVTVLVVGSPTELLDTLGDASGVRAIDATDEGCPINDRGRCAPLVDRSEVAIETQRPDVVVVSVGADEDTVARSQNAAAIDGESLQRLGVDHQALLDDLVAVVDVAAAVGAEVVFHDASGRTSAVYPRLARVALERPDVGRVTSSPAEILDRLEAAKPDPDRPEATALRVLVVGDSTSLILAQGLSDGGDGALEVTWVGSNGCPLVSIVALRPGPGDPWNEVECPNHPSRVERLSPEVEPDVVVLMTGSTEQAQHRFEVDGAGHISTSEEFQTRRTEVVERLLTAVGPDVPVLVADFPQVTVGTYAAPEFLEPERLEALNEQVADWATEYRQVERFAYRAAVEAREATVGSIRSDGVHVDPTAMEELARDVLVGQLIEQADDLSQRLQRRP